MAILGVCTLALIVAKTSSQLHFCSCSTSLRKIGTLASPRAAGNRGNVDITEARFITCNIPTLLVFLFFFNSRILQNGFLQTGSIASQFVFLRHTKGCIAFQFEQDSGTKLTSFVKMRDSK